MVWLKLDIGMHADTIKWKVEFIPLACVFLACELWFKKKVETVLRFVKRFEGF